MKFVLGFILGIACTLAAFLAWTHWAQQAEASGTAPAITPPPLPEVLDPVPRLPRTIYLNREGAVLVARGRDKSHENESAILHDIGTEKLDYPAFNSTVRRWNEIVECVRAQMQPFDVEVVDQRPVEPGYMMVMIGGRPNVMGETDHVHAGGLAPFNGQVIPHPIVFVFSRQLRNLKREVCETAAQEIAHAYGLDHTYDCRDNMTYRRRCGRAIRRFVDEDMRCGEHEERDCRPGGNPTQNSYAMLMEVLGPRPVDDSITDKEE